MQLQKQVVPRAYQKKSKRGTVTFNVQCSALTSEIPVLLYIKGQKCLRDQLKLSGETSIRVKELTEGKINHVFLVDAPSTKSAFILKHAPPYVKSIGKIFHLSQERLRIEVEATQMVHKCCPTHIPEVLFYDEACSVMVQQYLPPPHTKVMLGLHQHGLTYPLLPHQLSDLLSASLFSSSHYLLNEEELASRAQSFENRVIVNANERVVLTEPLDAQCSANRPLPPELRPLAVSVRQSPKVQRVLEECLYQYRNAKQALLHNDCHTGNLLATTSSLYCIDWEFATMGPMGFDLGCLLGVLLLAWAVLHHQSRSCVKSSDGSARDRAHASAHHAEQRVWLSRALRELWRQLCFKSFRRYSEQGLTTAVVHGDRGPVGGKKLVGSGLARLPRLLRSPEDWESVIWKDTLGFMVLTMIRLTIGMHSYPGYDFIRDPVERAVCESRVLELAEALADLREGTSCSMEDVLLLMENQFLR